MLISASLTSYDVGYPGYAPPEFVARGGLCPDPTSA